MWKVLMTTDICEGSGWRRYGTEDGRKYYYRPDLATTQWETPQGWTEAVVAAIKPIIPSTPPVASVDGGRMPVEKNSLGPLKSSRWVRASTAPNVHAPLGLAATPARNTGAQVSPGFTYTGTPVGKTSDVPYAQTPQSVGRESMAPSRSHDMSMQHQQPFANHHTVLAATPRMVQQKQHFTPSAPVPSGATPSGAAPSGATPSGTTPIASAKQGETPGSALDKSSLRKSMGGRKQKELPPDFVRMLPDLINNRSAYWIAPDMTIIEKYTQVDQWMQISRPQVAWSGARLADAQAATGQTDATAIDEGAITAYTSLEPPHEIAKFLGFVVYYLTVHEKEDEIFELVNGRSLFWF